MNTGMTIPEEWRAARRILAIRLDNLGDVLVTTPAIHAIHESLPRARITLLVSSVGSQAGALNPDITDLIVYNAPWMDPWQRLPQDPAREQAMIARIAEGRFDAAIIFSSFRQSPLPAAYLCYLAGIPLRLAASIDGPGSLLTTRHRHPEQMMHEVERGLDLVGAVGLSTNSLDLVLTVSPVGRQSLEQIWPKITGDMAGRGPLVVIHPGCSMPARTYSWRQYARAADLLIETLGARVIFTGVDDERELVAQIRGAMRLGAASCAGMLPFAGFCALIEAADLVITNNTGPMHVAAALKTPVVALFALTNPPEQWGPWRVARRLLYHDMPCRLCYARHCPYGHECLSLVEPEQVLAAASELLEEAAQDRVRLQATGGRL